MDDEAGSRAELAGALEAFGKAHGLLLDTVPFARGEDLLDAAAEERFDLVFLDIYMEGMDGLTAATRLRELDKGCLLVFLTSSGDHLPAAFSVHAFEYILKPLAAERVNAVLEDALAVLPAGTRYIEVSSGRRTLRLALQSIVSAVTDAHYLDIGLSDGSSVRSRMTAQDFLNLTGGAPNFIPVNKGIILNADYITRFEGSCCVTENGGQFPVRVRDRARLERMVREYHFENIRSRQRHGPEGRGAS